MTRPHETGTRRLVLLGAAAVVLATVAVSHLAGSSQPARGTAQPATPEARPEQPLAAVQGAAAALADGIDAARAADDGDPAGLRQIVAPLLAHLDIPRITALLFGRHWHRAGAAERAVLQAALTDHLVTRHGPRLRLLRDLRVSPLADQVRLIAGDTPRARVPVVISTGTLPETRIDLHLVRREGRWRLYDASLHGIGLVGLKRPVFTALATRHGLDGLPALLRAPAGTPAR
jgi:ABC-type transporter MlaC component